MRLTGNCFVRAQRWGSGFRQLLLVALVGWLRWLVDWVLDGGWYVGMLRYVVWLYQHETSMNNQQPLSHIVYAILQCMPCVVGCCGSFLNRYQEGSAGITKDTYIHFCSVATVLNREFDQSVIGVIDKKWNKLAQLLLLPSYLLIASGLFKTIEATKYTDIL